MTARQLPKDIISGILFVLLGGGALWATSELGGGASIAEDPALLPRVVGVGLIVSGVVLVGLCLVRRRLGVTGADDAESIPVDLPVPEWDDRAEDDDSAPGEWRVVIGLAAAVILYVAGAFELGFITSTAAFVVAAGLILGRRRDARSLIVLVVFAVVVAIVAFSGFFELLNVRMPITPLR
ncbi:tripartite tricarboxylate transporter TctB family protein [Jiangella asiatica]|uniref:Tripartite tricarboxylate transporter TctB family protein n=1 Tax=Jiangella asiatica TaxID=2530372 RepID=A0A4R5CLP8_9ACTN|nr:tripartite tricarboxylate transporter TctB family protein [Jiangella asiatica]TDE00150.1 tripartite tricarboxylate transporter TctB family protein [Jiangella asiatica]